MKASFGLMGGVAALLVGLAGPASAAPIVGTLGIAGAVSYDILHIPTFPGDLGTSIVDFAATGGGDGTAQVTIFTQTGYFSAIDGGSTARILDLTNDPAFVGAPPATGPLFAPPGAAVLPAINGFLQNFTDGDAGALRFDLTQVVAQSGATCVGTETIGQSCVEGPFALQDTDGGLRVNFDVFGFFRRGADEGFFKGSFSTTFSGLHFQDAGSGSGQGLFHRIDVSGLDIFCGTTNAAPDAPCTFDANFANAAAVPEPATLLTFGLGSVVMARLNRRRKKNQATV